MYNFYKDIKEVLNYLVSGYIYLSTHDWFVNDWSVVNEFLNTTLQFMFTFTPLTVCSCLLAIILWYLDKIKGE